MKNELTAVAEDLGMTMKRTARSLGAKEGSDFSAALVDEQVRLIAQSLTIGIHLGTSWASCCGCWRSSVTIRILGT